MMKSTGDLIKNFIISYAMLSFNNSLWKFYFCAKIALDALKLQNSAGVVSLNLQNDLYN